MACHSCSERMRSVHYLGYLVEFAEKLVEHVHQFSRRAVAGQAREPDDVCVQNAAKNVKEAFKTVQERVRHSVIGLKYRCSTLYPLKHNI